MANWTGSGWLWACDMLKAGKSALYTDETESPVGTRAQSLTLSVLQGSYGKLLVFVATI